MSTCDWIAGLRRSPQATCDCLRTPADNRDQPRIKGLFWSAGGLRRSENAPVCPRPTTGDLRLRNRLARTGSRTPGGIWDSQKDTQVHRSPPQATLRLIFDTIFRVYIVQKFDKKLIFPRFSTAMARDYRTEIFQQLLLLLFFFSKCITVSIA